MSQHDASPHEADVTEPAVDIDDGNPGADEPRPRTARRRLLVWLAVPVAVAFGAGGGYLAAEAWTPATRPPTAGHSSHEAGAAQTHDGPQAPAGHGADDPADVDEHGTADQHQQHPDGAGHEAASAPAAAAGSTGHDAGGGHASSSGHDQPSAVSRPRSTVLTAFTAINAAILVAAGVLRRRRPRPTRRTAVGTA